jgi:hypothetical protein
VFHLFRSLRSLLGPRFEDIVGLSGAIYDALPTDLAEQFASLDTANGIRVTLRTGQTFWCQTPRSVSLSRASYRR